LRSINVSAVIDISMPTDNVNFGSIDYLAANDTTDDSPPPFVIQNDGNALINVSASATSFWNTVSSPNDYYKFKVDNKTGQEGAFDWVHSVTSWMQMPITGLVALSQLDYNTSKNNAEVDIYVEVPSGESPGARNSTVTLISSLAE